MITLAEEKEHRMANIFIRGPSDFIKGTFFMIFVQSLHFEKLYRFIPPYSHSRSKHCWDRTCFLLCYMDCQENSPRGSPKEGGNSLSPSDSLTLMKTYFDKQFDSLKRELKEEVQSSSDASFKRFKTHNSHDFKFVSNRKQHEFNVDILDNIERCSDLIRNGEQMKSLDVLGSVKTKIGKRNKLIKLADKSAGGWDTVKEYCSDDLASDSDDDKKIRRAESRALAKRKTKKRLSATVSSPPVVGFNEQSVSNRPVGTDDSDQRPFRPFRRAPPQCFACGGWGHFRSECPRVIEGPGSGSRRSISGFRGGFQQHYQQLLQQLPEQQQKQQLQQQPGGPVGK